MMNTHLILIVICIFCAVGVGIVSAAECPTAPLGTLSALQEFVDWLCELAEDLMTIFTDAMGMLGLSNESYVSEMVDTMNDGMSLVNKTNGL
jgi:hypothetical protein